MNASPERRSSWPHLWAWVLCCATFPLLWVGGLITTTDAGMAVPDWPGTYGYNLFLYPWSTWLFGPWDLFIEHGHRLFASGVGLLTIVFCAVVWRCDDRRWLRRLALAALALVILQGFLGGLRVWLNERHLAMAHGATGPLFFALTAALVVLTARPRPGGAACQRGRWFWLLPALVYVQVVLGAALRHTPEGASFVTFAQHAVTHVIQALLVAAVVMGAFVLAWRRPAPCGGRLLPTLMAMLLGLQLGLGVLTWVAKYRLPRWANDAAAAVSSDSGAWDGALRPVTMTPSTAGGWIETHTITAHSAGGSLLLALSTAHAVLAGRRSAGLRAEPVESHPQPPNPESPAA